MPNFRTYLAEIAKFVEYFSPGCKEFTVTAEGGVHFKGQVHFTVQDVVNQIARYASKNADAEIDFLAKQDAREFYAH